jgi:hypothetical protein
VRRKLLRAREAALLSRAIDGWSICPRNRDIRRLRETGLIEQMTFRGRESMPGLIWEQGRLWRLTDAGRAYLANPESTTPLSAGEG